MPNDTNPQMTYRQTGVPSRTELITIMPGAGRQ
jgi:hypothetical protein